MTRTTIRHTLSAFAAVALVSVCSSSPVSAQASQRNLHVFNQDFTSGLTSGAGSSEKQEPKTLKGLATKKAQAAREAAEAQKYTAGQNATAKAKSPKALATPKRPPKPIVTMILLM